MVKTVQKIFKYPLAGDGPVFDLVVNAAPVYLLLETMNDPHLDYLC